MSSPTRGTDTKPREDSSERVQVEKKLSQRTPSLSKKVFVLWCAWMGGF